MDWFRYDWDLRHERVNFSWLKLQVAELRLYSIVHAFWNNGTIWKSTLIIQVWPMREQVYKFKSLQD